MWKGRFGATKSLLVALSWCGFIQIMVYSCVQPSSKTIDSVVNWNIPRAIGMMREKGKYIYTHFMDFTILCLVYSSKVEE